MLYLNPSILTLLEKYVLRTKEGFLPLAVTCNVVPITDYVLDFHRHTILSSPAIRFLKQSIGINRLSAT